MRRLSALIFVMLASSVSFAGSFDCSTIYDEFDSLMLKNFLIRPQNYVQVVNQRMSRAQYNNEQKGRLMLANDNRGWGVAIVHTNRNTWGKLLFTWGAPMQNGQPSLILKKVTLFGRVLDGFAPRTVGLINVPSSYTVDLDTGAIGAGNQADIWFHNVDGNTMFIEAVNGAEISFPMQSLCL